MRPEDQPGRSDPDESTLRHRCQELCRQLPELSALRRIALVGALQFEVGARDVDSIRLTRALDYLLRSDVPVAPDFEVDVINLFHGRDFLAESEPYDLVFVSFVPDVTKGGRLFPTIDAETLQRQREGDPGGRSPLRRVHFWQGRSALQAPGAWARRVENAGALLVLTFGGKKEVGSHSFGEPFLTVVPTPRFHCNAPYLKTPRQELYGGVDWDVPYKWLGMVAHRDLLAERPDPALRPPTTDVGRALARLARG